jgi:hypothetical protein
MSETAADLVIQQGQIIGCFAFDIGYEVSLERLRTLLDSPTIQPMSRKKQTPTYIQYATPPRVIPLGEYAIAGMPAPAQTFATVFDFGAVSLTYRMPLVAREGETLPLDRLPELSARLYNAQLELDARDRVLQLMRLIRPAIVRPELSNLSEDYFIFVLEHLLPQTASDTLIMEHAQTLAQVLRFDTNALSPLEQAEALSKPIAYYERDLALIDWNAAIVVDADYADTVSVLELINVELLEARYMDAELDKRVRDSDKLLAQRRTSWLMPLYVPYRQTINELAALRIEASLLSERVDNALKLIGDQYLARIHNAATERFYLHEWDLAISRKLDIIGNLYQLLTDRVNTVQAQTLELIIIILILIEILLNGIRH